MKRILINFHLSMMDHNDHFSKKKNKNFFNVIVSSFYIFQFFNDIQFFLQMVRISFRFRFISSWQWFNGVYWGCLKHSFQFYFIFFLFFASFWMRFIHLPHPCPVISYCLYLINFNSCLFFFFRWLQIFFFFQPIFFFFQKQ